MKEIEFEQTSEDLVALRCWFMLKMPERRWQRRIELYGSLLPALIVIGMFFWMLWEGLGGGGRWNSWQWGRLVVSAAAFIAMLLPFLFLALIPFGLVYWRHTNSRIRKWVLRQICKGRVDASFFQLKQVAFDGDGVRVSGDAFESAAAWSLVPNIVVDADHLFIFTTYSVTRVEAFIVPRWAFGRDDRFLAFCERAISYWEAAGDAGTKS